MGMGGLFGCQQTGLRVGANGGPGNGGRKGRGGQKERLYDAVVLNKQTRGRAGDHHADVVDKGDREKGSRRENASTCGKMCVLE